MPLKLTTTSHSRDVAGLTYVYPVISRRAGGLSIGINFNTNNACNWRCVYCQVPGLVKGSAPQINLALLENELTFLLHEILHGNFYTRFDIAGDQRVIQDVAISGNGEPTSLKEFDQAVSLIGRVIADAKIPESIGYVLITNGSLVHQQKVQLGLKKLHDFQGEVWFKVDSATVEGRKLINNSAISQQNYVENLVTSATLCPTWLQTCLLDFDGRGFLGEEKKAYLDLLRKVRERADLQGVLLYTIARPSCQPEADRLVKLSAEALQDFAQDIEALGFEVKVSV